MMIELTSRPTGPNVPTVLDRLRKERWQVIDKISYTPTSRNGAYYLVKAGPETFLLASYTLDTKNGFRHLFYFCNEKKKHLLRDEVARMTWHSCQTGKAVSTDRGGPFSIEEAEHWFAWDKLLHPERVHEPFTDEWAVEQKKRQEIRAAQRAAEKKQSKINRKQENEFAKRVQRYREINEAEDRKKWEAAAEK
jgi:hypothetical protein